METATATSLETSFGYQDSKPRGSSGRSERENFVEKSGASLWNFLTTLVDLIYKEADDV